MLLHLIALNEIVEQALHVSIIQMGAGHRFILNEGSSLGPLGSMADGRSTVMEQYKLKLINLKKKIAL